MLTIEDIMLLSTPALRRAVRDNLERDPVEIALDKRLEHAHLVATQVKYLQRARKKLPSYYRACCILPPLAYEQSSSESAAAHKDYRGALCIDLTCGLGVDSYYFSRKFTKVVSIERDAVLAEVARYNFRMLGAANIEVVNTSAEEFMQGFTGHADLICADPARRSDTGKKTVALSDCSPDISALLPRLREKGRDVVVKLSPMFDIAEVFNVFGDDCLAEVVSISGECKEVLAHIGTDIEGKRVRASSPGSFSLEFPAEITANGIAPDCGAGNIVPADYTYLIVPDVSLAKARVAVSYYRGNGCRIENDNGFVFCDEVPPMPAGKVYRIVAAENYVPKKLKKQLKDNRITRLNIIKKNFPYTTAAIATALAVREGGDGFAAFTNCGGALWAMLLNPV